MKLKTTKQFDATSLHSLPEEHVRKSRLLVGLLAALTGLLTLILATGDTPWVPIRVDVAPETSTRVELLGRDILSQSLQLQDPNWTRYDGADSPEGAYMGWLHPGSSTLSAELSLGQTIEPGRYYLFWKGINYDRNIRVTTSIGGGQAIQSTDDRDWNRYWTQAEVVDVITATDALSITLEKLDPLDWETKYLLRGLYLTSNATEIVLRTDVAVDLAFPQVMDNSPPYKANVVENGSFEVGMSHGWGLSSNRVHTVDNVWDNTAAMEGSASARLTGELLLISKAYSLKANKRYTLSAWVRAADGVSIEGVLAIRNTFEPPAGYPSQYFLSTSFIATSGWQRVSLSGYLLEYPTADYQIILTRRGSTSYPLWVDGIQLEEGDLTDYQPHSTLEVGLNGGPPSNIYYEDSPIEIELLTYNGSSQPVSGQVHYEIYDRINRKVREGTVPVTVQANSTQVDNLDLSTGLRGIFRVVSWVDGQDGTQAEEMYSILPRPQNTQIDAESIVGMHANLLDFQLEALQKLGIKWLRVMSPAAFFRWTVAEPQDDQFVWFDDEIQQAAPHGATILGTIGTNDYWPAWANNGGLPNLDKWEEYVEQLVTHYAPAVRYWEIWNEPNQIPPFAPDFYARMLKRAVDAIERADPGAQIVGMGGTDLAYMQEVITALEALYPSWDWTSHVDNISTHLYPGNGSRSNLYKSSITDAYGVPVWNTESGDWSLGGYMGSDSNFLSWGTNLWPYADGDRYYDGWITSPTNLSINFLQSIGGGLTKYFYYDSRLYAAPDYPFSHPTILEYDDTIRPKGIAYSILASLFDHSVGLGSLSLEDEQVEGYLFDRGGTALAALWTTDGVGKSLNPSLQSSQVRVYDQMGNVKPFSNQGIAIGRQPVYIEGLSITTDTLRSALEDGAVLARPDVTAPNLSISQAPTGPTQPGTLRIRWIALDDESLPSVVEPDAILYSYRMQGLAWQNTWSDWSAGTYADFIEVPAGQYILDVKAKDASGNEALTSRAITVGAGTPLPTHTPASTVSVVPATSSPEATATATAAGTGTVEATSSAIVSSTSTQSVTETPEANPSVTETTDPSRTVGTATPSAIVSMTALVVSPTVTLTPCSVTFGDVPPGHTFYNYIMCLACHDIVSGYGDGSFRPHGPLTRGQLSKIVSNAAGFVEPVVAQTFQDVMPDSTFHVYIERLAARSIISGYVCGEAGEPCVLPENRPYFRPGAGVTRGQAAKLVASAAGLADPPLNSQSFQDLPTEHTFYRWVERLFLDSVVSGYVCGEAGEPCVLPENRPYFRPGAGVTRGQAAKIVSNVYFPDCSTR